MRIASHLFAALTALAPMARLAPMAFMAVMAVMAGFPTVVHAASSSAIERAGANGPEIERAIASSPAEQRDSMQWLVEHMPDQDLRTLDAKFLLTHVDGAYKAWKSAPWTAMVDVETFRDGILPYASVSEKRELWMTILRARCMPMAAGAKTPDAAAVMLNQRLFPDFKVKYSTKRARADQSPSESMESGLASCTGLSILLVDACRAIGVPARFVGVPMWTDGSGNHSWVEVWDGANWRYTGAAEPSGDKLDEGWFSGRASGQNRDKPEHGIYAVTWRESGVVFPMMFDPSRPTARAVDVTDRYASKAPPVPAGSKIVRVCVRDSATQQRLAVTVAVVDGAGVVLAHGTSKDERFDLNDHLELVVPDGAALEFRVAGKPTRAREDGKDAGKSAGHLTFFAETASKADAKVAPEAESKAGSKASSKAVSKAVWGAVSGRADAVDGVIEGEFMMAEVFATRRDPITEGDESASAAAMRDLQRFLKDGAVAEVAKQPFATVAVTNDEAERASILLWKVLADATRKDAKAEFDSRVLECDGVKMPFWYAVYGDKPKSGRSMFISMHGGGGAPKEVNDGQWENQKKLYKPAEGVYIAPRAPTDTWNLWHQGHIDPLFAKLIRDMIVFEDVDPNRVYIMGYSAGGDGVYQLAPRMADYYAAASMMAGHPNETQPDGLRNIPFTLHMGGEDKSFNRNAIGRQWKTMLAEMAAKDPGGYINEVVIHEGKGHWMDREDAVAVAWMAKYTRNLRPTKIVWLQDDVTSPRFYWLANPSPKVGQKVVATRDGQSITIAQATGCEELVIRLDDMMVDLDKPVKVLMNGATLFDGIVPRNIGVLATTLGERGDPTGVYFAEVRVKLPPPPTLSP